MIVKPPVLKVRAWNAAEKKMISAEELGADELQLHPNGRGFFNASGVSPKLSQYYEHLIPVPFTGFYDVNGEGVYCGDWLQFEKDEETLGLVWWQDHGGFWAVDWEYGVFKWRSSTPLHDGDAPRINHSRQCLIVGNSYAEPKLAEMRKAERLSREQAGWYEVAYERRVVVQARDFPSAMKRVLEDDPRAINLVVRPADPEQIPRD